MARLFALAAVVVCPLALATSAAAAAPNTYRLAMQQTSPQGQVLWQTVRPGCGTALRGGNPAKRFMWQRGRRCFW